VRDWLAFVLTWLAALLLGGCAHTFLIVGVGVVHVDRKDDAIGISSRMIGLQAGCRQLTIGLEASYCVELPSTGDVAIVERTGSRTPRLRILTTKEFQDEVIATARDR
jgi:hypothetical protein